MKKLFFKLCLLSLTAAAMFTGILYLSSIEGVCDFVAKVTGSEPYEESLNSCNEVLAYIEEARLENDSTKLIIGDSVCNSLFNELEVYNPDYTIIGCNKGITMAGQYILLQEYFSCHDEVTDVYLIVTSNSLITGFDTEFGYPYAAIPFVKSGTISHLDEETVADMEELYYKPFLNKNVIDFLDQSTLARKLYLNVIKDLKPTKLTLSYPDVTIRYIKKMHTLCQEKGVTMHLISPPYADTEERRVIHETLQVEYENSELYPLFPKYFETILYYDAEMFPDGMHPYVDRSIKDEMVLEMIETNGGEWDVKIE